MLFLKLKTVITSYFIYCYSFTDIWLESKDNTYGPDYSSGRFRIAMSRGNQNLNSMGDDISCKSLEVGVVMGVENNIRELTSVISSSECWNSQFHEYSLVWTHSKLNSVSYLCNTGSNKL